MFEYIVGLDASPTSQNGSLLAHSGVTDSFDVAQGMCLTAYVHLTLGAMQP